LSGIYLCSKTELFPFLSLGVGLLVLVFPPYPGAAVDSIAPTPATFARVTPNPSCILSIPPPRQD